MQDHSFDSLAPRGLFLGLIVTMALLDCRGAHPVTSLAKNRAPIVAFHQPASTSPGDQQCELVSTELVFSKVAPEYRSLKEATAVVKNVSSKTLALDPIQAGSPAIFRYNEETRAWEEVNTWRCANAGAGTVRELAAGVQIAVSPAEAGVEYVAGDRLEVHGGVRPRRGLFVMALRYKEAPWKPMTAPKCALTHSGTFKVD